MPDPKLPELTWEYTGENHVQRVRRWNERLSEVIDEANEVGLALEGGSSEAHAGMDAEFELMEREAQLLTAVKEIEIARQLLSLAQTSAWLGPGEHYNTLREWLQRNRGNDAEDQ